MKRLAAAVITAIAISLMASAAALPDTLKLSQQQWKHALAVIAQQEALDGRYGQPTDSFALKAPDGMYTLDDLNECYRQQTRWGEVYTRLKAQENEDGTIARVKAEAGQYAPAVVAALEGVMAKSAAQPAQSAETLATEDLGNQPEKADAGRPTNTLAAVSLVVALLSLLLAGFAAMVAMKNRRRISSLKKSLSSAVDDNLAQHKSLIEDVNRQMTGISRRVGTIESNTSVGRVRSVEVQPQPADHRGRGGNAEKTLYLSRPDENECFTRISEEFEPGNSLFVLTTLDGQRGTFHVIDNRDVHHFALMMPTENLMRACTGNAIQMANGKTRIVTDRPGEAQLDNGKWRITLKANIHYEN